MSYQTDNLEYSLCKRIPAMGGGFSISTNYGEIFIEGDEGKTIITAVTKIVERQLARAQKREALLIELKKAGAV